MLKIDLFIIIFFLESELFAGCGGKGGSFRVHGRQKRRAEGALDSRPQLIAYSHARNVSVPLKLENNKIINNIKTKINDEVTFLVLKLLIFNFAPYGALTLISKFLV